MWACTLFTQECIERAAEKTGHRLEYATRLGRTSTSRLANGTIVVPRAAELDTHVMQSLPAAMQFEVLEEIQLAERSRRRDVLVTSGHTMDSFSHTQLANYIEVSKVAQQVRALPAVIPCSPALSFPSRVAIGGPLQTNR